MIEWMEKNYDQNNFYVITKRYRLNTNSIPIDGTCVFFSLGSVTEMKCILFLNLVLQWDYTLFYQKRKQMKQFSSWTKYKQKNIGDALCNDIWLIFFPETTLFDRFEGVVENKLKSKKAMTRAYNKKKQSSVYN